LAVAKTGGTHFALAQASPARHSAKLAQALPSLLRGVQTALQNDVDAQPVVHGAPSASRGAQ
jgi:hypothetical protein